MAFDNYYPKRKDNRRVYKKWDGAKRFASFCRNHGGCSYCVSNRRIHWLRELDKAMDKLKEFGVL